MKKIDVKIFTQKLLANFTHNYKKNTKRKINEILKFSKFFQLFGQG